MDAGRGIRERRNVRRSWRHPAAHAFLACRGTARGGGDLPRREFTQWPVSVDRRAARRRGVRGVRLRPSRPRQVRGARFYIDDIADYTEDLGTLIHSRRRASRDSRCTCSGTAPAASCPAPGRSTTRSRSRASSARASRSRCRAPAPVLALVRFIGPDRTPAAGAQAQDEGLHARPGGAARARGGSAYTGEVQPARTVAALLKATDRMRREFRPSPCRC